MPERITSATKKILQQIYQERAQKVREDGVQKGELMQEQDGWHSEAAQRSEEQFHLSRKLAGDIEVLLKDSEEMLPPAQNDVVELGHKVLATLLDDEDVIAHASRLSLAPDTIITSIHLLSTPDKQYLSKIVEQLDDITEMIVSNKSPVGKALLGAKRNDTVTYGRNMRIRILDKQDAIIPSPLLNLQIEGAIKI